MLQSFGKYFILLGALILFAGVVFTFFPKLNMFGKLPGDIVIKKENYSFYFPVVTSIVISIILTLVFWAVHFFSRK